MNIVAVNAPEFSRPIHVESMRGHDMTVEIVALPEECRALAERFDIVAIETLSITARIARAAGGRMFRVSGSLSATVVQTCVVTLESVTNAVSEEFSTVYAPPALIPERGADIDLDPVGDDEDDPEPLEDGRIDVGELAAQYLSLALDMYPRRPDAAIPAEFTAEPEEEKEDNVSVSPSDGPFAALSRLASSKKKQ
ncbi:DUF177 domain-containing protein [Azospirillaceae bacterium]